MTQQFRAETPPANPSMAQVEEDEPMGDVKAEVLATHAIEIRGLCKRAFGDIVEIGRRLIEAKKICGHGNWLPWLEREFGWTDKTAQNYMNVATAAGKNENFSNLDLPVSGLYLLARPDTPAEVIEAIAERSGRGDTPKVADIRQMLTERAFGKASGEVHRVVAETSPSTPPGRVVPIASVAWPERTTTSVTLDGEEAEALHLIIKMEVFARSASEAKMAKLVKVASAIGRDHAAIRRVAEGVLAALDACRIRH
jgi:hypothetical protein